MIDPVDVILFDRITLAFKGLIASGDPGVQPPVHCFFKSQKLLFTRDWMYHLQSLDSSGMHMHRLHNRCYRSAGRKNDQGPMIGDSAHPGMSKAKPRAHGIRLYIKHAIIAIPMKLSTQPDRIMSCIVI